MNNLFNHFKLIYNFFPTADKNRLRSSWLRKAKIIGADLPMTLIDMLFSALGDISTSSRIPYRAKSRTVRSV